MTAASQSQLSIDALKSEIERRKRFDEEVIRAEEAVRLALNELNVAKRAAAEKRKAHRDAVEYLCKIIRDGGPEPNLFEPGGQSSDLHRLDVPESVLSILRANNFDDLETLALWLEAGNDLEGIGVDAKNARLIADR